MSSRKERAGIAKQTIEIMHRGTYTSPGGNEVDITEQLRAAREGTILYRPDDWITLPRAEREHTTEYRVINCTTLAAARELIAEQPGTDPMCLNFASAKNPGGGFINGSQAQEESLARASGLYACISPVRGYYGANRACRTKLYTHHVIYSPQVPVFRDDDDLLLEEPYLASMITAPACNVGAMRKRDEPDRVKLIERTMLERIDRILEISIANGHDALVLGAWGCGVFRNDPEKVARWFRQRLGAGRYAGHFRQVTCAVLDGTADEHVVGAFRRCWGVS